MTIRFPHLDSLRTEILSAKNQPKYHTRNCAFHVDQYISECDCGTVQLIDKIKEVFTEFNK